MSWPNLNRVPREIVADLSGLPFNDRYKHHPHIEQSIFKSVEEIVSESPEDLDIRGEDFGKLRVVSYAGVVPHRDDKTGAVEHFDQWWVSCDCGSDAKKVGGNHLRSGNTRSCGCARGRYGKRTENYHTRFPVRFESWKHPGRFAKKD